MSRTTLNIQGETQMVSILYTAHFRHYKISTNVISTIVISTIVRRNRTSTVMTTFGRVKIISNITYILSLRIIFLFIETDYKFD